MKDLDIFTIDGNKINKLNSIYDSELYDNKGLSANTTNICFNKPFEFEFEFEYKTNTELIIFFPNLKMILILFYIFKIERIEKRE